LISNFSSVAHSSSVKLNILFMLLRWFLVLLKRKLQIFLDIGL
jgi:hypothetical protein